MNNRMRKRKEYQQMILVEQTATLARQSTICFCITLSFHFGYIFQLLRKGNVQLEKITHFISIEAYD